MKPSVDEEGTKRWFNEFGQSHRLDGPAVERADGSKEWWINDRLHRIDGPAVEYPDGSKYWYQNDLCHRIDGPAVEKANGTYRWFQHNLLHRLDGPAVKRANGEKYWFVLDTNITEWIHQQGISDNPTQEEQVLIRLTWGLIYRNMSFIIL